MPDNASPISPVETWNSVAIAGTTGLIASLAAITTKNAIVAAASTVCSLDHQTIRQI